ncbi:MAG TPA: winged helix-turn-helix domain-containing protein [Candidatus Acidoferrales bacterium]|nr:winged helix-turn-helix domain-containing protein [Candidatus Acidoferrales bacterium]
MAHRRYQFGEFRLDAAGKVLFRGEKRIPLTPKVMDTLLLLVESSGNVVDKDELMKRVWPDTFVEEISLTRNISVLRKVLGDGDEGREFIETIPKRGYRFVAPVKGPAALESTSITDRVMLAVLPIENLGRSTKHDYFSDGLTEEMITHLARLNPQRLGVIARTSAMQYRSTGKSIQEIGRELGVSYILEGSVRRAGHRLRITAQLIQVRDESHLWAESYERRLGDILAVQDDVARAVAKEIRIKLAPQDRPAVASSVNPQAYEAYLKGRYLLNRRTVEALQKSVQCFERAIQHDAKYPVAYAGLADSYLTLLDVGHLPTSEATKQAKEAAGRALRADDTLAEAHCSLGHAHFHDFNWSGAGREFSRAIELNPNYANTHYYYCNYLVAVGRNDEAVAEAEWAQALDPMSLPAGTNLSNALYFAGRYEEAATQALKVLDMDSTFYRAQQDLGRAYEQQGKYPQAIAAFRKAVASSGRDSLFLAELAYANAVAGKQREALKLLQELKKASKKKYVSPYTLAVVSTGLGNRSEAFSWLAKAFKVRDGALPFVKANPRLAPLRSDPRFQRLLRRLNLAS